MRTIFMKISLGWQIARINWRIAFFLHGGERKPQRSFFDLFSEKMDYQSYLMGRGIGDSIMPQVNGANAVKVTT